MNEVFYQEKFFLKRWLGNDYTYAENLEVEFFQLTDDHVADMLANPQKSLSQPTKGEMYNKSVNGVIRIKNKGKHTIKGTLQYLHFKIDIDAIPGVSDKETPRIYNFIFPTGIVYFKKEDKDLPEKIEFSWRYLFTN
jgi:hypothetical protein